MRQLILFTALLCLAISCRVEPDPALPAPQIVKIADQVYALLAPAELPNSTNMGYMVNSTIIIGSKGVIVIDTGFTDVIGRHIKQIIAGITSKPVTHVINTHDHGDHVLGNSEFKGAEIISSAQCKILTEESGYEWISIIESLTGQRFPNTIPVSASKVYQENTRTSVVLQGVKLVLWVPVASHTAGDLMVYLPDEKILVAGDIVVNTMMPSFRDAQVKNWIAALEQVSAMPISTIVPGHGSLMTKADVQRMHQRMAQLYKGVEAGFRKGLMGSEIRETIDLKEWKKLSHFNELMGINLSRTYLEVEADNF